MSVAALEKRLRRVISRLAEQCRENTDLMEFSGRPLTAKKARTRCKKAHTGLTNATDDIMQCHANGLLSDESVREMLEPILTQLEPLVSSNRDRRT
jgi:hypothetical protein